MSKLNISLTTDKKSENTDDGNVVVEFSPDQFERFAASLGLFSDDFLQTLDKAEKECDEGNVERFDDVIS